jgi:hypothetical protein
VPEWRVERSEGSASQRLALKRRWIAWSSRVEEADVR